MSLSGALYEELVGATAITDLVGTRVYLTSEVEQDPTLPYVTFTRGGANHVDHMTAASGLAATDFQIDGWADNMHDAETISEAVRATLHHFSGTLGTGAATATVGHIEFADGIPTYIPPDDQTEFGTSGTHSDITIWHTESVPSV